MSRPFTARAAERPLARRPQTYCSCGEKKLTALQRFCTECRADKIDTNNAAGLKRMAERAKRNAAAIKAREGKS